jgi:hypothetical protein
MNLKWAPRPGGRAAGGAAAFAESKQTRMASSLRLAGERRQTHLVRKVAEAPEPRRQRPEAAGVVSGGAAEGRSTAPRHQTSGMWSEQLERVA